MSEPKDFNDYLMNTQEKEKALTEKVKAYLSLKLQKAKELKRPTLVVNVKNLMAEMNIKASPKAFAQAMLALKKPTDEILFGDASHPGISLTISYDLKNS